MNIKRAKQEIKNTIRAYQLKNADGTYRIPSIRQRPVLLMGPPGVGKTQIMEQIAEECDLPLVSYRSPIIQDRAPLVFHLSSKKNMVGRPIL